MYGMVNVHEFIYSTSMTSVLLASIIKLSGAASSTSDSVIPSKGSLSRELLMACWTTLSHSSPVRQGWFSLKQWMCPSSDPSTATVSAQLLNESIIILLSKPSHAARIHLTISLGWSTHFSRCSERVGFTSHPFIILLRDICFKWLIPNHIGHLDVFRTTPWDDQRIYLWCP